MKFKEYVQESKMKPDMVIRSIKSSISAYESNTIDLKGLKKELSETIKKL